MASIRVITGFAGAVLRILHDHSWDSPTTGNLFLFCSVSELFWDVRIVLRETHDEPPFRFACNPLHVTVIDDLSSSRKRELSIEPDPG